MLGSSILPVFAYSLLAQSWLSPCRGSESWSWDSDSAPTYTHFGISGVVESETKAIQAYIIPDIAMLRSLCSSAFLITF